MNRRARTRVLGLAAIASIVGAGFILGREPAAPRPRQRDEPSAVILATPSPTPTATAKTTATSIDPAAARVARAYALASSNWSPRTYRAAYERQVELAHRRLRRQLQPTPPTRAQLMQLAQDRQSRLGAVLATRPVDKKRTDATTAAVLVDVDELHLAAGRRSRQIVTYRADLRREHGVWHVSRFASIRGGRP